MPVRHALQLRSGQAQGTRLKIPLEFLGCFCCGLPRANFVTTKWVEWRWRESNPCAKGFCKEVYMLSELFCL